MTVEELEELDELTTADLVEEVNAPGNETLMARLLKEARTAVVELLHDAITEPPPAKLRRAVLDVASEAWAARQAPNGVRAFSSPDGVTPVHVSLDTTLRAKVTLSRYLVQGIG